MKKAYHILVEGRVQGVGFRWSALRKAKELNIYGYVRNLPDGNVEIWAEGEENHLETFLAWCRQGPPAAHVINLTLNKVPVKNLNHFEIK